MAKEPKSANVTYFRVDSDGYIYLRSATPQEGYKEYFNRDGVSLGYKKIFSATDDGYISFLGVRTAEFDTGKVEYVSVSIKNGDSVESVQFPLVTQKGGLSNYAKALAQVLPNIKFEDKYSLSFDKRKDEAGYTIKNIYFNQSDVKDTPAVPIFHKYKNKTGDNGGDIPNMEQTTGLGGKVNWDTSKQDNFLYASLMEQIERFKAFSESTQSNTSQPKDEAPKANVTEGNTNVFANDEDDDLPF